MELLKYKKKPAHIIMLCFALIGLLVAVAANVIAGIVIIVLFLVLAIVLYGKEKKAEAAFNSKVAELEAIGVLAPVKEDIANGQAKIFKKLKLIVTPRAIVTADNTVNVIQYTFFDRAFKTNIIAGDYKYDQQAIALVMNDGNLFNMAVSPRSKSNKEFDDALTAIRNFKGLYVGGEL